MELSDKQVLELLLRLDAGNPIKPEDHAAIGQVTGLSLKGASITVLPESIGHLVNLQTLDLSGTQITALPESIGQLANLQTLDLSSTWITALPESVGRLIKLQMLDLNDTPITALPESIGQLANLQTLNLWRTPITALPASVGQLANLQTLDLSDTQISALPDSVGQLINLEELNLTRTSITALPESLGQLAKLDWLRLCYTGITVLPEWIGILPSLRYLDLKGLKLLAIPESLAQRGLPFTEEDDPNQPCIVLKDVTLTEQDKSIFLEHPELIPSLYRAKDLRPVRECRVIFLGDGASGKSYTIQRFRNQGQKETEDAPFATSETPGVKILDYTSQQEGEPFTIYFWDFGGQEILHSMHRCFLTDNTCYVVTVTNRESKTDQRARYWLRNVNAFAPNSPILLFVNCWGNSDGQRSIDEPRLRYEFPMIRDVVYCNTKQAEDAEFRMKVMEPIIQMAFASKVSSRYVPAQWARVREAIEEESRTKNYLDRARYHAVCEENGIQDEQAPELLSFFNALGVCFSYHRDLEKKELAEYKLLNPVWLTNALYAIIVEGRNYAMEGQISRSAIEDILCSRAPDSISEERYFRRTVPGLFYQPQDCSYILDVAVAYNLCYPVDKTHLFFPALCDAAIPKEALSEPEGYSKHIGYILCYSYLPDSILHQLMIRCLRNHLAVEKCWLRGMILYLQDRHAIFVRMIDEESLRVDIYSSGEQRPHAVFWMLRKEIEEINRKLNLSAKDRILNGDYQFSVGAVLEAARQNRDIYDEHGNTHSARILLEAFFDDIFVQTMRVENGSIVIPIGQREYHRHAKSDPALRRALYEAYNRICPYCGREISNLRDMEVDHILAAHSQNRAGLKNYLSYLVSCGFDIEKPDYIENYFPTHGHCNRDKSNQINEYSLPYWHDIAFQHTPRVLQLIEQYHIQQKGILAQEATEIINQAIGEIDTSIPSYQQFLENVNSKITKQMLPYLVETYSYLFAIEKSQTKLTYAYKPDLQEILFQVFLLDRGIGLVSIEEDEEEPTPRSSSAQTEERIEEPSNQRESKELSSSASSYTTPSDLEKATELVLREFVSWLSLERKNQGLHFQIRIPPHRQSSGLQYGYDVGIGTSENQERFNLCFECKHYKTNMSTSEDSKNAILKVDSYSYNLLQYYMHCQKEVNSRWILISTYGDLQNDFPQKLFENWNIEHSSIKIFAITESTPISCKDFLATSEEAYKMVYGEMPSGGKSKEEVFGWLDRIVIGKDWVEENIKERLRYSSLPLPEVYRTRNLQTPLLQIRTKTNTSALLEILNTLSAIDIPYGLDQHPNKYGVYVIGEYGTGKTWLSCQAIEEIIRHPGKYPFEPFYIKLKGILNNSDYSTLTQDTIQQAAKKYVDSKLGAEALKSAFQMHASVFFLDGFDEALSGLSFTDAKISLLYEIMDAIRNVIPESLFVVTSRESDYEACKKHPAFETLIDDFTEVRLKDCTREQVKENISIIAEQPKKDAVRLKQLLQNESIVSIICRPVFYSFISCIAERPRFARNCDEKLDEYDVLDEVIESELQKMSERSSCEKQLYEYAFTATCKPDEALVISSVSPELLHEESIARIIPVGVFDIWANDGTPQIEFKHNILREFLVAKYLYSLLRDSVSDTIDAPKDVAAFISALQNVPINVAVQTFFIESMQKDHSFGKRTKERLLSILQTNEVKKNVALATKLLQMLLLPGSRLCGEESLMNLSGIRARNLYLWNCVLSNLDLSGCAIDGFQIINAELNNINFQKAIIYNMQVCSDVPIAGITHWQNDRIFEVALLLSTGQLLRYSIRDQFDSEHIEVKILDKIIDDSPDGLFCVAPDVYSFQRKAIYSQMQKLYETHSDIRFLKITSDDLNVNYLLEKEGFSYTSSFTNHIWSSSYPVGKIGGFEVDSFYFISTDTFMFAREGKILLRRGTKELSVRSMYDEIDCFCGRIDEDNSINLYLLSAKRICVINVPTDGGPIKEKVLSVRSNCKRYKHVETLNDWVLLATDETRAFLIKLYENGCEVIELASGVKCQGLLLGDAEKGNRIEDDTAYRLLSSMNS